MSASFPIDFPVTVTGADEAVSQFNEMSTSATDAADEGSTANETTINGNTNAVASYAMVGASIGMVANAAVGTVDAYDTMNNAQLKLQDAALTAANAQSTYNQAVADYGPNSDQATTASNNLTKAQNALQIAQTNAGKASSSFDMSLLNTATSSIPAIIMSASGLLTSFGLVGSASTEMAELADGSFVEMDSGVSSLDALMDANPIGIAILVIVAAVALLYEAWTNNFGGIQQKVKDVWSVIEPVFADIGGILTEVWQGFLVPMASAWSVIFEGIGGDAEKLWSSAIEPAFEVIEAAINFLWQDILVPAASGWEAVFTALAPLAGSFYNDGIKPAFSDVETAIKDITSAFTTFESDLVTIWEAVTSTTTDAWDDIAGGVKAGVDQIIDIFNGFIGGVNTIIKGINDISSALHMGTLPTIGTIPALAAGGITTGPGLFVAGEAGPEQIAGAKVTPLSGNSADAAGGVTNHTYNISIPNYVGTKSDLMNSVLQGMKTAQMRRFQ